MSALSDIWTEKPKDSGDGTVNGHKAVTIAALSGNIAGSLLVVQII